MTGELRTDPGSSTLLLKLFLMLDFRDRENSGKKKFIGIITAYLVANTAMAFNYFSVFDKTSFVILSLSSCLFLMALLAMNEYDNLILAGSSIQLLSTLPLDERSVFRAKFLTAMLFLLPFASACSIPPAVFYYFYDHNPVDPVLYFLASVMFSLMLACIFISVYSVIILKFPERAALMMTILQALFFAFVFYSSISASGASRRGSPLMQKVSVLGNPGAEFLPQTFIASSMHQPWILVLLILACAIVVMSGYFLISRNYAALSSNALMLASKRRKKKLNLKTPEFIKRFVNSVYLRNDVERSSFYLVADHLTASRFLRIRYVPYFIMPIAFILVGLLVDAEGLLYLNTSSSISRTFSLKFPMLSPSITIIMLMSSRMLISNTKIMDDITHGTDWIYRTLPQKDGHQILKGVSKFFYLVFFIPVMILLLIVLSARGSFEAALVNVLFTGFGIYFINSVASLFDKTMPFTIESGKFNSASKLLEIFTAMIIGIILILIQIFAFQNTIFALATIASFIIISFLLNRN